MSEKIKYRILTGFGIEQPDGSWKLWCAVEDRTEPFVFKVSKVEYDAGLWPDKEPPHE